MFVVKYESRVWAHVVCIEMVLEIVMSICKWAGDSFDSLWEFVSYFSCRIYSSIERGRENKCASGCSINMYAT